MQRRRPKPTKAITEKITEAEHRRGARLGIAIGLVIGLGGVAVFGWQRHQRNRSHEADSVETRPVPSDAPAATARPLRPPRTSWSAVGTVEPTTPPAETTTPALPPRVEPTSTSPTSDVTTPGGNPPRKNSEPLWRQRARHY